MMNGRNEYQKRAVALQYHEGVDVPRVKAKGSGMVAEEIIKQAKEHNIPIHEDPALVQMLSELDLDEEIPAELYAVVAEVFALIYQLEQKAAKR